MRAERVYRCPLCAAPVSIEGKVREGLAYHDCPKHGPIEVGGLKYGTREEVLSGGPSSR
jgi:hypothetical protein